MMSLKSKARARANSLNAHNASFIVHPASMWQYHYTDEQRNAADIGTGLIRLSVGIEHIDDLIADFERALSEA